MIVNFSQEMEWFTFNYDRLKWLFKLFWRNGQRILCHFVGKEKWRPFENETRKTAAKLHFRKEQSMAFNKRNCSISLTNYFSCNISNSITQFENEITDTFRLKLISFRCQRLFPCGFRYVWRGNVCIPIKSILISGRIWKRGFNSQKCPKNSNCYRSTENLYAFTFAKRNCLKFRACVI